jgi:recombination associated protein RdgC
VFKNAKIFRLLQPFTMTASAVQERLQPKRFRPCAAHEQTVIGWIPPLELETGHLVYDYNDCLLMTARRQERILPTTVLNEALADQIATIEEQELRTVKRRERTQLKEALFFDMLPRAFTRSQTISLYIDRLSGWLIIDTASDRRADELVSLLRTCLEHCPVTPLRPQQPITSYLTDWLLSGPTMPGVALEDQCELRDALDEQSIIRCRGQNLMSPEIQQHLNTGKQVVALRILWNQSLSLILDRQLNLKRLQFAEEDSDDMLTHDQEDDTILRLNKEFMQLTHNLREILQALTTMLIVETNTDSDNHFPPA